MLEVKQLSHSFYNGTEKTTVLKNINFRVESGELISLLGSSGSGKSTLLNLMAGLMKPTQGSILISGKAIEKMNENQLAIFRRSHIGFVFQSYELLSQLTVIENVELPLVFQGMKKKQRQQLAEELLEQVGLKDKLTLFPSQLSGGQQQRVSIARSLVTKPEIVFADEPTGNLDSKTEQEIIDLLIRLNHQLGITFLIVTHEQSVAQQTKRILRLQDGVLIKEEDA